MARAWTVDEARDESARSAGAGFPYLLSFGITWHAASAASFLVSTQAAAWIYLLQGLVAMPVAVLVQRRTYPPASGDNPLNALALQLVFIQPVAFPAFLVVLSIAPAYVPTAFAAVVGAHFLPFAWLHRTRAYIPLGIGVSVGAYATAIVLGQRSLHYVGFVVGAMLLIGAFAVRAPWRAGPSQPAGAAS